MLEFKDEATIDGDHASLWQVASDIASWQDWDPHVEKMGFEGPFEVGSTGWTKPKGGPKGNFTVIAIDPGRSYTTDSPMPMGKMIITTTFEPAGEGKTHIIREVALHGAFSKVFKKLFMPGMRRDMYSTFDAMAKEAARRQAAAGS